MPSTEQAKIAACFAAFVTKDPETHTGVKKGPALIDRMEPGIVQELSMGEAVSFGTPPTFNGYTTYSWQALHAIAVGLGVPFELLTGDLKGVNFPAVAWAGSILRAVSTSGSGEC